MALQSLSRLLMQKIYWSAKHSSGKYTSYVSIILLTDVNLWAKLYKQQQNIDGLSSTGATSGFYCDRESSYTKQNYMSVVVGNPRAIYHVLHT